MYINTVPESSIHERQGKERDTGTFREALKDRMVKNSLKQFCKIM